MCKLPFLPLGIAQCNREAGEIRCVHGQKAMVHHECHIKKTKCSGVFESLGVVSVRALLGEVSGGCGFKLDLVGGWMLQSSEDHLMWRWESTQTFRDLK